MRCPICEEPVDPDRRQLRSSVYVFCCDRCAPKIRQTFEDERERELDRDRATA